MQSDTTDNDAPVLGRGLQSLIPKLGGDHPVVQDVERRTSSVFELSVDEIDANERQPRHRFDDEQMDELATSIRRHGILQPLVVMKRDDGYELIAGERRLRAARRAGLATVPVIERSATDQERLELALVENIQRKDLNPLERASGYQQLMEDFDLTQEDVADRLGMSRSMVTNTLRLLTLPSVVRQAILDEQITEGHAKILLGLSTGDQQERYLEQIMREGLSIRETADRVGKEKPSRGRYTKRQRDQNIIALEKDLEARLKTRVRVKEHKAGGKIEVDFYDREDLRRVADDILQ